ncbi:MAG TPA: 50S ribosomal protein L20 [Candidatus Brocadiia bacterium]|nr:50S ribosomal protein L20 [Candidatus Brocadiia bacterium]
MRVTSGPAKRRARKRLRKEVKGYWGKRSKWVRLAKETLVRSQAFATAHRRRKKRDFRSLWIIRISAAAKQNGISYNRLIDGVKKAGIEIDRKMLAALAVEDPQAFARIAEIAKQYENAAAQA